MATDTIPAVTRILVAPDKFKGTLSARQAADAIAAGIADADPGIAVHCMPLADGGEGTVDAFLAAGGTEHRFAVRGPVGQLVEASWVGFGSIAVIELAQACGLALVDRPNAHSALVSSSHGAGQLIREVAGRGYQEILIGVGGVATTDGGMGAMHALGLKFLRSDGMEGAPENVHQVAALDATELREVLDGVKIRIATDVTHVLTGPEGAAAVFAPQKGADPQTVSVLERRLERWADLLAATFGADVRNTPGSGAAGGFAVGFLAAASATIESGLDAVAGVSGFADQLGRTDLVVVAEGKLDDQSLQGKAPIAVARRARDAGLPVIALAGVIDSDAEALERNGVASFGSLLQVSSSAEDAMKNAALRLRELAALTIAPFLGQGRPL